MILCAVPWNSSCDLCVTATQTQNTWYRNATERKVVPQWSALTHFVSCFNITQNRCLHTNMLWPKWQHRSYHPNVATTDGEGGDMNATRHQMNKTGLSRVAESICSHLQHAKETSCAIWTRHHEDTSFNWVRFFLYSSLLSTWLCAKWSITSTETLL